MSSSASSTAGTPEEQPVNDSALTAIDPEQSAPENATDQVESEAPTRVYLHPRAAGNDPDPGGSAHPRAAAFYAAH